VSPLHEKRKEYSDLAINHHKLDTFYASCLVSPGALQPAMWMTQHTERGGELICAHLQTVMDTLKACNVRSVFVNTSTVSNSNRGARCPMLCQLNIPEGY